MICDKCIHKELCKTAEFEHFYGVDMCDFYIDVKHGKWVNPEMGYEDCSVCGYCFAVYDEHEYQIERNFCPNCGADMREERRETDDSN